MEACQIPSLGDERHCNLAGLTTGDGRWQRDPGHGITSTSAAAATTASLAPA